MDAANPRFVDIEHARRRPVLPVLMVLTLCIGWYCWDFLRPWPQIDDAFISYRYAQNLVEGHGLVFNPGERVEGITNLLWTLLVAGGMLLGFSAPIAGHGLGFASGLLLLGVTWWFARKELYGTAPVVALIPVVAVLASPPFAGWAVSGLETPLFAAATTGAFAAYARRRFEWSTAALMIATLTRPEGGLAAVVIYLFYGLSGGLRNARFYANVGAYGCVIVLLTGFRLWYYGQPVPNTFYAKVGGIPISHGVMYVGFFLLKGTGLLIIPAITGALRMPAARPAAAYVLCVLGYVAYIGGDAFGLHRFLLPAIPLIAVVATWAAATAQTPVRSGILYSFIGLAIGGYVFGIIAIPVIAAVAVAVLAAFAFRQRKRTLGLTLVLTSLTVVAVASAIVNAFPVLNRLVPMRHESIALRIANWNRFEDRTFSRVDTLLAIDPAPSLVAVIAIGRIGFYSQLPILDLLGLTTPRIARSDERPVDDSRVIVLPGHHRSNSAYVLAREPDIILLGSRTDVMLPSQHALVNHPEFQKRYEWDPTIGAYRRK